MLNILDATPLENLLSNSGSVVTNIISLMGTVSTALMSNELFQLTIGVVVFGILMCIVYSLVRKVRKRGR